MRKMYSIRSAIVGAFALSLIITVPAAPVAATEPGLESLISRAAPSDQPAVHEVVEVERERVTATIDGSEIRIPLDGEDSIELVDGEGAAAIEPLPGVELEDGEPLDGGSVAFAGEDGTTLVVQAMEDASVRLAVVIGAPDHPTEYEYRMVPEGGRAEAVGEGVLIFDAAGSLVGGLLTPWARDQDGAAVPTRYEIRGRTIVQVVEHDASHAYPIVADPLFARGMIKRVNKEKWNSAKGGYELQAEVTALARWTWAAGRTDIVIVEGYRDLKEHYPRSMSSATMFQQWECHAVGLIGTFKIDLEGWRSSKPNWRKTEIWTAVKSAIRNLDPTKLARACNW